MPDYMDDYDIFEEAEILTRQINEYNEAIKSSITPIYTSTINSDGGITESVEYTYEGRIWDKIKGGATKVWEAIKKFFTVILPGLFKRLFGKKSKNEILLEEFQDERLARSEFKSDEEWNDTITKRAQELHDWFHGKNSEYIATRILTRGNLDDPEKDKFRKEISVRQITKGARKALTKICLAAEPSVLWRLPKMNVDELIKHIKAPMTVLKEYQDWESAQVEYIPAYDMSVDGNLFLKAMDNLDADMSDWHTLIDLIDKSFQGLDAVLSDSRVSEPWYRAAIISQFEARRAHARLVAKNLIKPSGDIVCYMRVRFKTTKKSIIIFSTKGGKVHKCNIGYVNEPKHQVDRKYQHLILDRKMPEMKSDNPDIQKMYDILLDKMNLMFAELNSVLIYMHRLIDQWNVIG
jgi:hypothetical protein